MKKLFFGALLMVGMTALAQEGKPMGVRAQKEMSAQEREDNQLKRYTVELKLDEAQQKEMAAILKERSQKREAMVAERKAAKEKGIRPTEQDQVNKRAEREAFNAEQDAKVRKILTKSQLTQWDKMKDEEKDRRKEKMQQKRHKVQKSE